MSAITKVSLAVSRTDDGEYALMFSGVPGMRIPLVAIGDDIEGLRVQAQDAAMASGKDVEIISFTERQHCETFRPF